VFGFFLYSGKFLFPLSISPLRYLFLYYVCLFMSFVRSLFIYFLIYVCMSLFIYLFLPVFISFVIYVRFSLCIYLFLITLFISRDLCISFDMY